MAVSSLSPNFRMKPDPRVTVNRHKSIRYSKIYRESRNPQRIQIDPVANEFILMNKSCECISCGLYNKKDKLIYKHLYEGERKKLPRESVEKNE